MKKSAEAARDEMIMRVQEIAHISDRRILDAMQEVPRHLFAPQVSIEKAYECSTIPGDGSYELWSISAPDCIATMLEALKIEATDSALDIGGGSGYHAAILSRLARSVVSVERIADLTSRAQKVCDDLGYDNIRFITADGNFGWPYAAPYDVINVACASDTLPTELVNQLKPRGRIILPLVHGGQGALVLIRKDEQGNLSKNVLGGCYFVPMRSGTI